MKRVLILAVALMLLLGLTATPVLAKPPTTFTVNHNQGQAQWRGVSAFGDWTPGYSYDTYATSTDFVLTGKVLHTSWSYSPVVTDLSGESTVYVYDKSSELWIEHEGTVSYGYIPGYDDFTVVNYFGGYLDFGGNEPSTANFVHGVAYQWCYVLAPEDAILDGAYTEYAFWDETVGAWLAGFSIYVWDPTGPATLPSFPSSFPEPVPASDYNPLDL